MDPVSRRARIGFAVWQLIGVACGSLAHGPFLWAIGCILLLPGSIIVPLIIEFVHMLTGLPEPSMGLASAIGIPVVIVLNGVAYWSVPYAWRSVKRIMRCNTGGQVEAGRKDIVKRPRTIPIWASRMAVLVVCIIGVSAISNRPVLVHVFAEWDCACGDFHDKVTGIAILNPLRDRHPEQVADAFLKGLQANHCEADDEICEYALPRHRISDWRLVNRADNADTVKLYFQLTKYGTSGPGFSLSGEGMILLVKGTTGWQVTNYSSYF